MEILKMQIMIFKRIDILNQKLKEVNDKILERVTIFEEPEESTDEIVKENLKIEKIYLSELKFLDELLREIELNMCEKKKPTVLSTDYFIRNFSDTQDALDYINDKLKGIELMYGARELFTGLAYGKSVASSSPTRLFYVTYKFIKIFGFDIEMK